MTTAFRSPRSPGRSAAGGGPRSAPAGPRPVARPAARLGPCGVLDGDLDGPPESKAPRPDARGRLHGVSTATGGAARDAGTGNASHNSQ
jgi:hypothetical protein